MSTETSCARGVARLKQLWVALAAIVVLSCSLGACAPSGPSDEEIIQQGIAQAVTSLKSMDAEDIAQDLGQERILLFEELGLDAESFVGLFTKRLSYSIEDIAADGDHATATLKVTNIDFEATAQQLTQQAEVWFSSPEAREFAEEAGELGVIQKMFSFIEETLSSPEAPLSTHQETVALSRDAEGNWSIDDKSAFSRALLGDSVLFSESLTQTMDTTF
ncbi:MAG: hypothetical protein IJ125_00300 [Atopobiaceae bacterium]|nr:hypothetical protein [Atopobiaceae bacterium]